MSFKDLMTYKRILIRHIYTSVISWWLHRNQIRFILHRTYVMQINAYIIRLWQGVLSQESVTPPWLPLMQWVDNDNDCFYYLNSSLVALIESLCSSDLFGFHNILRFHSSKELLHDYFTFDENEKQFKIQLLAQTQNMLLLLREDSVL